MRPLQSDALKKKHRRGRAHSGFTIVELVVVVAIIGLLASMAIPGYQRLVLASKKSERTIVVRNMEEAIFSYLNEHDQQFQWPSGAGTSWTWLDYNPPARWTSTKKAFIPTTWGWPDFSYEPSGDLYYHYYAYGWATPDFAYFYIGTVGDLDANGVFAWYYKYWYRDATGIWYPLWEWTWPTGEE